MATFPKPTYKTQQPLIFRTPSHPQPPTGMGVWAAGAKNRQDRNCIQFPHRWVHQAGVSQWDT